MEEEQKTEQLVESQVVVSTSDDNKKYRAIYSDWFNLGTYIVFGAITQISYVVEILLSKIVPEKVNAIMTIYWFVVLVVLIAMIEFARRMAGSGKNLPPRIQRWYSMVKYFWMELGLVLTVVCRMIMKARAVLGDWEILDLYSMAIGLILFNIVMMIGMWIKSGKSDKL